MSRAVAFRIGEEKSEVPTIYIGRHTITSDSATSDVLPGTKVDVSTGLEEMSPYGVLVIRKSSVEYKRYVEPALSVGDVPDDAPLGQWA